MTANSCSKTVTGSIQVLKMFTNVNFTQNELKQCQHASSFNVYKLYY